MSERFVDNGPIIGAPEVRAAYRFARGRRVLAETARGVLGKLTLGVLADLTHLAGLPLEEGPVKRVQDRLRTQGKIK